MPRAKIESRIKNSESRENTKAKPVAKTVNLSIPVYSITGEPKGNLDLPKVFGGKINNTLLAQAMRVYTTNDKTLTGSTKTRGQVQGSTKKIYAQKGTGRARQGSIRAPHRVGGGIVFGPTPRKVVLDLPKKMKKAALLSAIAARVLEKKALAISDAQNFSEKLKK